MPGDQKNVVSTRLPACNSLKPQHHHKQEKSSPTWRELGSGWPTT